MIEKKRHITAMISYYVSLCMLIVCSLLLYAAYCCMQSVAAGIISFLPDEAVCRLRIPAAARP